MSYAIARFADQTPALFDAFGRAWKVGRGIWITRHRGFHVYMLGASLEKSSAVTEEATLYWAVKVRSGWGDHGRRAILVDTDLARLLNALHPELTAPRGSRVYDEPLTPLPTAPLALPPPTPIGSA